MTRELPRKPKNQKAKIIQDITQMISSADIHMLLIIRNSIQAMME